MRHEPMQTSARKMRLTIHCLSFLVAILHTGSTLSTFPANDRTTDRVFTSSFPQKSSEYFSNSFLDNSIPLPSDCALLRTIQEFPDELVSLSAWRDQLLNECDQLTLLGWNDNDSREAMRSGKDTMWKRFSAVERGRNYNSVKKHSSSDKLMSNHFVPWGGKRADYQENGKREFHPWGGKRSIQVPRKEKKEFHPWGGRWATFKK